MEKEVTPFSAPFLGTAFFVRRPRLWLIALLGAFISFALLVAVFCAILFVFWPSSDLSWEHYLLRLFESIGFASLALLLAWAFLLPFLLNLSFQQMQRRVLREVIGTFKEEGFLAAIPSSIYVMGKTLGWRILWPLLVLLTIFTISPISALIAQMGIGHLATIDGIDLSLSLMGKSGKERVKYLRKNRLSLLGSGIVAGIGSMLLMPTLILWLFWISGIYVGAALLSSRQQ